VTATDWQNSEIVTVTSVSVDAEFIKAWIVSAMNMMKLAVWPNPAKMSQIAGAITASSGNKPLPQQRAFKA
jgi:hypothetical protein